MGNGRSKPPAFQWYAADWLADAHVRNMSVAARGLYVDMLSLEWREGPIADDRKWIAKATSTPEAEVEAVWQAVRSRFVITADGKLANERLERERRALAKFHRDKSVAGKLGNKVRWGQRDKTAPISSHSDHSAITEQSPSSASASAIAIEPLELIVQDGEPPKPAAPRKSVAVVKREGRTHEAVTAHLQTMLAPERREAFMAMQVEGRRRVLAEFIFAYWQIKLHHQQALYDDQREGILVRALKANRDNVSELLYVVDGAIRDPWQDRKDHNGIEVLFRNRSQVERFASFCPNYKADKPHHTAVSRGLAQENGHADVDPEAP